LLKKFELADFQTSLLGAQLSLATAAWKYVSALHTSEFEKRENINNSILVVDPTTRAWHERSRRLVACNLNPKISFLLLICLFA